MKRPDDITIDTDDRYSMSSELTISIIDTLKRVEFSHDTQNFGIDTIQIYPEDLDAVIEYLQAAKEHLK